MADSLSDILNQRDFSAPPEIDRIKNFIRRKFDSDVNVHITNNLLVIAADSAALASTLRLNWTELVKEADTDKKIMIRIG